MSKARRYWFLFVLTLVVTLNYVDRYVLSILVEPIRADFALSDTQIGLRAKNARCSRWTPASSPDYFGSANAIILVPICVVQTAPPADTSMICRPLFGAR